MAESESCSDIKKKREECPNNQVDKQGKSICSELPHSANVAKTNVEKHDFEIHTKMEHAEETSKSGRYQGFEDTKNRRFPNNFSLAALIINDNRAPVVSEVRMSTLSDIMEALTRADIIVIGTHGKDNAERANIVETVLRRAKREDLFNKFAMANVTRKPNLKMIQGELAHALGFTMEEKSVTKRAGLLCDRIKMEPKILVILREIDKGIDLDKVGIPFGDDHTGCKILLTSSSEEILSNQMHAQKVFMT